MKKFVGVMIAISVVTVLGSSALYNQKAIGASSENVNDFSTVTSGPGNIMPDSKFYFVDKLYQEVKLSLAFTPAQRSTLHMQILGERMAELRVMQARDNKEAMVTALTEVEREGLLAASDLRDAGSRGERVGQKGREMYQSLGDTRSLLLEVAQKYPDTVYAGQLESAADSLNQARQTVLAVFPEQERERELAYYAQTDFDEAVLGVATSTMKLENRLKNYERYASDSAKKVTSKQRQTRIAEIKKKIAELQVELRLLVSEEKNASATPTPKK